MSCHVSLAGIISDESLHRCQACIKELEVRGCITSDTMMFFTTQWDNHLKRLQNQFKGAFYQHKGSPIIIVNGSTYIGGVEQFLEWAL